LAALNQNGVYSALFSPLGRQGELDKEKLKTLIHHEIASGAEGFYCCGSSGEGLLLETEERKAVAEIVAGEVQDRLPFIVHTGALSTRAAIDLSVHAKKCGASAVSLIPPIYYNYSVNEIEQYYTDILNTVDIGVIVYNIPQFTSISFSKKNVFLNDKRIIGIKHTSMNLYDLERIKQAFPDKIIFNGFDEIFLSGLSAGADAAIGLTINIFPKLFIAIREEFHKGNISGAKGLQLLINDFIEVILGAGVFPAAKYCMTLQGIDIGPCRKPFAPLSEENKKQVKEALEKVKAWI